MQCLQLVETYARATYAAGRWDDGYTFLESHITNVGKDVGIDEYEFHFSRWFHHWSGPAMEKMEAAMNLFQNLAAEFLEETEKLSSRSVMECKTCMDALDDL